MASNHRLDSMASVAFLGREAVANQAAVAIHNTERISKTGVPSTLVCCILPVFLRICVAKPRVT